MIHTVSRMAGAHQYAQLFPVDMQGVVSWTFFAQASLDLSISASYVAWDDKHMPMHPAIVVSLTPLSPGLKFPDLSLPSS
jgi:hypothetical protein